MLQAGVVLSDYATLMVEILKLLNDAIFGAIYYRMLLRSGPMTRRFGEELVDQVIRGHRSGSARS